MKFTEFHFQILFFVALILFIYWDVNRSAKEGFEIKEAESTGNTEYDYYKSHVFYNDEAYKNIDDVIKPHIDKLILKGNAFINDTILNFKFDPHQNKTNWKKWIKRDLETRNKRHTNGMTRQFKIIETYPWLRINIPRDMSTTCYDTAFNKIFYKFWGNTETRNMIVDIVADVIEKKQPISESDLKIISETIYYILDKPVCLPPKILMYILAPTITVNPRKFDFALIGDFLFDLPKSYATYIINQFLLLDIVTSNVKQSDITHISKLFHSVMDELQTCVSSKKN